MIASSVPPMSVGAGLIVGDADGAGVTDGVDVGDVQPARRTATNDRSRNENDQSFCSRHFITVLQITGAILNLMVLPGAVK